MIKIYFDGASSPHKHNFSAWAVVVVDNEGNILKVKANCIDSNSTNNEAELLGAREAVRISGRFKDSRIIGDSLLAIRALCCYNNLKNFRLKKILHGVRFNGIVEWVPRKDNLAGKYLSEFRKNIRH